MISREHENVARGSLLLRTMPDAVAQELLRASSTRGYERGQTIFMQGEPAQCIHVVLDGWIKLFRIAPNGNEAVVHVGTRGSSVGEAVAIRNREYPVSCEAVTDCTLLLIPAHTFTSLMMGQPELCISILAAAFQHLHELVGQVEQMKAKTGAQRVAEFLLKLAPCDRGSCVVTLPYDKILIAGRLGMKPESLSRAFSKLQSVGVRITKNHAAIDDIEKLRSYSDEDPAMAWNKAL